MNRAQLMKMGAVLATVPVFSAVEASTAEAMNPRINPVQHLRGDHGVIVAGPWGTWDSDAQSARVTAILVQGDAESAESVRYVAGAGSWTVFVPGHFKAGPANVHATAVVFLKAGGVEFYDWQAKVRLA